MILLVFQYFYFVKKLHNIFNHFAKTKTKMSDRYPYSILTFQKVTFYKEDIMNTKGLDYTILTIVIIGAINWGLIGFFRLNLITLLFGEMTIISRVIYAVVGLCGLYLVSLYGRVATSMGE